MQVSECCAEASIGDAERPITALPIFDTFALYGFADGRLVGVDNATGVVAMQEQKLPCHERIFDPAHRELREVLQYQAPSVEDFRRDHLEAFVPAVINDLAKDWKAFGQWDHTWFATRHAAVEVEVSLPSGRKQVQRLDKYLGSLKNAQPKDGKALPYLRGWYYEQSLPELKADLWSSGNFHEIVFEDWFHKLPRRYWPDFHWLFLGGASASTPLHVDPTLTHAWLTQLHGRKRFVLFPPCDLVKLVKAPCRGGGLVSLDEARERGLPGIEVILNPGDTLFVPIFWAHFVECIDSSTSLTWNFLGKELFPVVRAAFLAYKLGVAANKIPAEAVHEREVAVTRTEQKEERHCSA